MAILRCPDPKSKQGAVLASPYGRKEFPRLPVSVTVNIKGYPPERRLGLISECPVTREQARPADDRVLGAGAGSDGTGPMPTQLRLAFRLKQAEHLLYDT